MIRLYGLVAVMLLSGCASFSSTVLSRLDDNSLLGNSNGCPRNSGAARPYKGVPITLKLPTHLDVFVEEDYFLKLKGEHLEECLGSECRLLSVRTEVIKSEKVFTVDFKRPGAGSLGLNLGFDENEQYFSTIDSKLKDDTITQSAALLAGVIDSLQALPTSGTGPGEDQKRLMNESNILRDRRVVAYQRFDISALDFELQVAEFVNQHLNCCNQCSSLPTYDTANVEPPRSMAGTGDDWVTNFTGSE